MSTHGCIRIAVLALAAALAACGGGGGGGDGAGAPGKVTVVGGTADGGSAVGDTVHVFADPPASNQVFDHWSGDTSALADPSSWHTTFVLGSKDRSFTAVFAPADAWTPTQETVNGVAFWYHVPASPAGLVLFFHGTGGTGPQWFSHPEFESFVRAAVARGYGVASITASDTTDQEWTLDPVDASNPDIANVEAAWNRLVSRALIDNSTPRYVVGLSSGGRFSVRLCSLIGCDGQALVSSQGDPPPLMQTTTVPTRFNMNQNDTQGLVDDEQARRYSQAMVARGVRSEFEMLAPSPVYPGRFARIDGLTAADSQAIYDALKTGGFLDANDFLVGDPYQNASGWIAAIPSGYRSTQMLIYIAEELYNAYTSHNFYSEAFPRTMAFFEGG